MNILSIYYTHKPGGLCKRLYRLLSAIQQDPEHKIVHLCLDPKLLPEHLQKSCVQIPFPLPFRSGIFFWIFFTLWVPCFAYHVARKEKIQRFLCFQAYYAALLRPASMLQKIPIVLFLRSLVFQINRLKRTPETLLAFADALEYLGIRGASSMVYMNESMKRAIEEFAYPKGVPDAVQEHILPNDLPKISEEIRKTREALLRVHKAAVPEHSVWIITSGVLDERKNVEILLQSFPQIKNVSASSLLIAGEGSRRRHLETLMRDANAKNVFFLGWQENILSWVACADIIVFPSLHEGISNALLEALSLEKCVLLSDIPEHRELKLPSSCYFSPRDATSLARLLEGFIRDPKRRESMAREQARLLRHLEFDWDKAAKELVGV